VGDGALPLEDVRAIAEALADVLAERGILATGPNRPRRVLNAADVAEILGRDRRWVYAHAEELGAFRYGDGPKGRLGFDLGVIERWKRERQLATTRGRAPRRGRPPKGLTQTHRVALLPFEA
jgi:hypothetical protein